jgi:hypothetical protein
MEQGKFRDEQGNNRSKAHGPSQLPMDAPGASLS